MTYELAKELKEAGFSQFGKGEMLHIGGIPRSDSSYLPTLEELIEACGKSFYSLTKELQIDGFGKWAAFENVTIKKYWGTTPTEAVANLWLALNKKDKPQ